MNDGTFDGALRHQRACPPLAGKSERDSSRALNFARGSFASFLAPSRKEENKLFKDLFWTRLKKVSGYWFTELPIHDLAIMILTLRLRLPFI
jgi:hypothetical protein